MEGWRWLLYILEIFALLSLGDSFQGQHLSLCASLRQYAALDDKYMTRCILLEHALALEKNTTYDLYREVEALQVENKCLTSQLESTTIQNVLLESDLTSSRKRERKFEVRSVLLLDCMRKLRYENQELHEKLALATATSSSISTSLSPLLSSSYSLSLSSSSSSSSLSVDCVQQHQEVTMLSQPLEQHNTELDPISMESLDDYSKRMNVEFTRAVRVFSSCVQEFIIIFLLKSSQMIKTMNKLLTTNTRSLFNGYRRFMKSIIKFFNSNKSSSVKKPFCIATVSPSSSLYSNKHQHRHQHQHQHQHEHEHQHEHQHQHQQLQPQLLPNTSTNYYPWNSNTNTFVNRV